MNDMETMENTARLCIPQNVYFLHSTCVSAHYLFLLHRWKRKSFMCRRITTYDNNGRTCPVATVATTSCTSGRAMLIDKAILRFRVKPLQSVFPAAAARGDWSGEPEPRAQADRCSGLKAGFAITAYRLHASDVTGTRFFTRGSSITSICSPLSFSL